MEEKVKEQAVFTIKSVKIKNDQLSIAYRESFPEANYGNAVTKDCEQFVHDDLKYALSLLRPHVAAICEMPEAKKINVSDPSDEDLNETLKSYIINGYSKGGSDESAGVTITAQKILTTGKILNITVPFMQYQDEAGDGYPYGEELASVIKRCDYEVDAYLFEGKWGLKQQSFDFDTPVESDITGSDDAAPKKKKGRKKKEETQLTGTDIPVFDNLA